MRYCTCEYCIYSELTEVVTVEEYGFEDCFFWCPKEIVCKGSCKGFVPKDAIL